MAKGHAVEDGDEAARSKIVALPPCAASAGMLPARRPPVRCQRSDRGRVFNAKSHSRAPRSPAAMSWVCVCLPPR